MKDPECKYCKNIFKEFDYFNLGDPLPDDLKGIYKAVYTVKVEQIGESIEEIIKKADDLISKVGLSDLRNYLEKEIELIKFIEGGLNRNCKTIYIGESNRSSTQFRVRIESGILKGSNHPTKYPIWILDYFGWKFQVGWKPSNHPKEEEEDLFVRYIKEHEAEAGCPPLNKFDVRGCKKFENELRQ